MAANITSIAEFRRRKGLKRARSTALRYLGYLGLTIVIAPGLIITAVLLAMYIAGEIDMRLSWCVMPLGVDILLWLRFWLVGYYFFDEPREDTDGNNGSAS